MKIHPKSNYKTLERKAKEHQRASEYSSKEGDFDACVSGVCLSLINYMDALSINFFGNDNKCTSHEQAPIVLLKKLNQIGRSDFKTLAYEIREILNLKNLASYQGKAVSKQYAKKAISVLNMMNAYYDKYIQKLV